MSVFTELEYGDFDHRPSLDEAWERLPVLRVIAGYRIRWIGPLLELHEDWVGDLAAGAWGYLEKPTFWTPTWHTFLPEGPMFDRLGRIRADWSRGFRAALEQLVQNAEVAGPESDPNRWASWLCWELSEPNAWLRAEAARRGCDR